MPFDPTDPDTKAAIASAIAEAKEAQDAKNAELLGEVKKLKGDLRKVQDIKPEDMAALESENEKLRADLATATKTTKDATTAAEKATKALEAEQGFTQRLLIQDGLKTALLANGVKDEDFIDSLTAKFASGASIKAEGDVRTAMFGDKALADHIKEWAGSDAGKKFIAAPVNSGGGAGGGRGGESGKTLTNAAFNELDGKGRAAFMAEGGTISDAAA